MPISNLSRNRMRLWLVAALALLVSSAAMPTAFAEDEHHDDHHDRDRHHVVVRRDRDRRDHDWHSHPYIAPVPGYSYAPPVVYAPEPEPSGINIILPLNIH